MKYPKPSPGQTPRLQTPQAVRAWISVVKAYNLCDAVLASRLAALGLSTSEHEILVNLFREPGLNQQALVRRCFTAKSHVSALLQSLQKRGLLKREVDPADARAKQLFLLAPGKKLAEKCMAIQNSVVAIMAEPLEPSELTMIQNTMERINEMLELELLKVPG
jgi:DNA-binding MarR family transcriptional regulator